MKAKTGKNTRWRALVKVRVGDAVSYPAPVAQ